ncbi:NADP-dependent aryl-alcohol dehydrogenase [Capsulimonas corticalis]|uniref:NADP-dependent aryl-alcohol dehydrogenase n=1 Tax=Capsulimonas corticalis TaxID=2219043 RepID=A0A402CPV4_9BACT|nr:aldo/keto reductase [Capsulimonas corticalis]BDI32920.1 NADP-dependent aryl-alcohol dehydrogenase [Capsulimonas corticalis]
MELRNVGRTGLQVSEICLGTMQFGWTADEPTSFAVMDAFREAGGNFIDTADIYTNWAGDASYGGKTEEIIGKWMTARGVRQDIVLATKVRGRMWAGANGEGLSRSHILRACDESLRRLQTDYIDLYQCHWADLNTPIEETLETMNDLVRAGKVRYIGASNYPAWRLMEAVSVSERRALARFDSYQPEYSLMERQLFEYEAAPFCKHYGLGVIPYSPLAGGFLTGKYRRDTATPESVRAKGNLEKYGNEQGWAAIDALDEIAKAHGKTIAQTALAWQLSNPVITAPIVGANTSAQLTDALGAAGYRLSAEEMTRLNEASKWSRNWRPIWD